MAAALAGPTPGSSASISAPAVFRLTTPSTPLAASAAPARKRPPPRTISDTRKRAARPRTLPCRPPPGAGCQRTPVVELIRRHADGGLGAGGRREQEAPRDTGRPAVVTAAAVAVARAGPGAVPHLGRARGADPGVEADLVGGAVVRRPVRADRQGIRLPGGVLRKDPGAEGELDGVHTCVEAQPRIERHPRIEARAPVRRKREADAVLAVRVARRGQELHGEVADAGCLARAGGFITTEDGAVTTRLRDVADAGAVRIAVRRGLAVVPDL